MSNTLKFLQGGGKMGELIRSTDWSQTSLGLPETWPDSLITAVNISLNSGFPIAIYWGKDFTLLYNDSWSSIPGDKHPWALGKPGAVVWPEIWEGLKNEFENVLKNGESYRRPDALLLMNRYGYTEECYFDYTLSPVVANDGSIGGVFNAVIETTYKVINDRRNKLLYNFLQHANLEQTIAQSVERTMSILIAGKEDISFCMLYLSRDNSASSIRLTAHTGLTEDQASTLDMHFLGVANTNKPVYINNLQDYLSQPLLSIWPEPVKEAMIVPITNDDSRIKGYAVLGANSRKKIDADYRHFLISVGMHIGSLLNNGYSLEIGKAFKREQLLNEELSAANEELAASNEEITSVNEELRLTQDSLNRLNNDLEERVHEKTTEVINAQLEISYERDRLKKFFMQAPAGICILDGPDLVFELVNHHYQQLFPGRELIGKPILEALPEIKDQQIWNILQDVYHNGKSYEGNELHVPLTYTNSSIVEDRYFNFIYQPRYNNLNVIDGILVFVFEVTDSVESKFKIKESESKFRNLVMTSHYPLMILRGYQFCVEIANQEIAKLWGKTLDQIIGKNLIDILPELEGQPFPALLKQVMDTGIPYGQEEEIFYINTSEGLQAKYISFYYDPIIDDDGKISGIIVTANDISNVVSSRMLLEESNEEQQSLNEELAAANEELITTNEELNITQRNLEKLITDLAESESRFRILIQDAPVAIAVFKGRELVIESANNKILQIWGKQNDILGQTLAETLPELQEQGFLQLLDGVFTSGNSHYGFEHKVIHYHNNQRVEAYHNFIYQPIKTAEGTTVAIIVVAIDVTEQVKARLKVEDSEKRLTFMLNAIPQQVWTAQPDGTLNYVNQIVCEDFGHSAAEVIRNGWSKFIHPDDLTESTKAWQKSLESEKEYLAEFRLLMRNGEYRWHLSRALPYTEDGKITLWLGTNTDIQLQKNNEQKKDEFLSIASHELKTPLTSIKAFNQLMQRSNDPAKMSSFIKKSGEHIFRLEKLINDLLDVTRINAGKMTYNMEPFNFNQILVNSIEGVQHISPMHQIILESAVDITYIGDQYRLEQVMQNFLSNAVKYSPNGQKVIVNSKIVSDNIIVSVQDFGIGIAHEHIDKLFDRYYRVDNTAMRFEGLGLGLFISSEILKRHQGSFWIESEQGKGSTFFFRLPLHPENKVVPVVKTETYYKDSTITINYNEKANCLETDWIGFQSAESVMNGCMQMLKIIKKNNAAKILNDNRNVQGTWSEASEWVGQEFFPMMERAGVKYLAWIFSPSIFSQLSAQKSIDVAVGNITTQFFTDLELATQWLDNL